MDMDIYIIFLRLQVAANHLGQFFSALTLRLPIRSTWLQMIIN